MGLFLLTILGILSMLKINAKGNIHPAKIWGKDFAMVGDEVEFVCSTYGLEKENDILNIYLCKNGLGTQQQLQKDKSKTKFYINDVKKEDSGNYSCVYSKTEYKPSDVRGKGDTSVFLQVSAGFLPADIALKETSVMEGNDVEFTCTVSGFWRADSSDVSYTYLYKDGTAVKIEVWDSRIREVIFTLSKVHVGDSGSYSCVVISSKSISRNMTKPQGNNAVDLQVHRKETKEIPQELIMGLFGLLLLVSMLLGLWSYRQNHKQGQRGEANLSGENLECHNEQAGSGRVQPTVRWNLIREDATYSAVFYYEIQDKDSKM
ncbi:uncharacterized protein LOC135255187 isoform X2 [Anguilla rostrata]|uniref:uncharacterized protein LOC135255187 isoform X2 n=1 Tax=Anguilla rostrata TaxID=7938 RepID=UPI0030CCD7A7